MFCLCQKDRGCACQIFPHVPYRGSHSYQVQASLPAVAQLPHPPRPSASDPEAHSHAQSQIALPPPPEAISTTPLLGTPPNSTLHALYTSQIATLIWWTLQETRSVRRPVVVGLTLSKSLHTENPDYGGEDEEDEVSEGERERFLGIMDMIIGWPGPGE